MLWLFFVILSYFIFAAVVLVDKYLLSGKRMSPAVYTFYIGVLGMLAFFLVPFVGFTIPSVSQILLSIGAGAFLVYAVFWFAKGVQKYEPSRIIPAMGALDAILVFLLVFATTKGEAVLSLNHLASLFLLVLGTLLITFEKRHLLNFTGLRIALINAAFFAGAFVMAKYVYLSQPFWSGFILMRLGGLLVALLFLFFFREVREELAGKGNPSTSRSTLRVSDPMGSGQKHFWENPRVVIVFLLSQSAGAGAEVLRSFAVFLVPLALLPFINALLGIQYVAILVFAALLSWKLPHILKEHVSRDTLLQKIFAILLMALGLGILGIQ
ncbi:MAG: hypothetical protein Q8O97_01895 [bacterium]|nr:hypothetical protein [bacterium]